MTLDEIALQVTTEALNEIMLKWHADAPPVSLLESRVARFPFLENGASNNAFFLELTVSSTPKGAIPNTIVLKAGKNISGTAERELRFYKLLAERGQIPQIAQCYGTRWLEGADCGLLLLEKDIADEIVYQGPVEQHLEHYKTAARVLAELHAHWWDHPDIGTGIFKPHWTDELLSSAVGWAKTGLARFVGYGRVSSTERQSITEILSITQPLLVARAGRKQHLCVNHGDAALWNFVMDKLDPSIVKLIDFQMWCVNPPAWDIGYMIFLLWPTEFRARFGSEIIESYLNELEARGVPYGEAEFFEDLRICIVGLITLNMANYNLGLWPYEQVKERLSWILEAYHELDCSRFIRPRHGSGPV